MFCKLYQYQYTRQTRKSIGVFRRHILQIPFHLAVNACSSRITQVTSQNKERTLNALNKLKKNRYTLLHIRVQVCLLISITYLLSL